MTTDRETLFVDTNVWIYAAENGGKVRDLIGGLRNKFAFVISSDVLQEVSDPTQRAWIEDWLVRSDGIWLEEQDGQPIFYEFVKGLGQNETASEVAVFEETLYELNLGMHRETRGHPLKQLGPQIVEIKKSVSQGLQLDSSDFLQDIEEIHSSLEPVDRDVFAEDREKLKNTKMVFGNFKPPNLVKRVEEHLKSIDSGIDLSIVRADSTFGGIVQLSHLLTSVGFCSDKRLRKPSDETAMKGSRSQVNDIKHIATARNCNVFLTADKDCAKLAFAVYEYLGVETRVLYLSNREEPSILLGEAIFS